MLKFLYKQFHNGKELNTKCVACYSRTDFLNLLARWNTMGETMSRRPAPDGSYNFWQCKPLESENPKVTKQELEERTIHRENVSYMHFPAENIQQLMFS